MQTLRFVTILAFVIIAAGATIALAWGVAGDSMPVWQAAIGPLLLLTILLLRFRSLKAPKKSD